MSRLDVIGGVYRERCIWPEWDHLYGSGGRAAAAVCGLVDEVVLHAYASDELRKQFESYRKLYGFAFRPEPAPDHIAFDYVHAMSVPTIRPVPSRIRPLPPFRVRAAAALRFGMMEGSAVVEADRCVYDPQSAFRAAPFEENGSVARQLAIVANRAEVMALSVGDEPVAAAKALVAAARAEVVVVKAGALGAYVVTAADVARVPAFRSDPVWTIGSGDVFAAVFAAAWAARGAPAVAAAEAASRAVAEYAASSALPARALEDAAAAAPVEATTRTGEAYLAAPFFSMGQRWLVDEARRCLGELGLRVFSPVHDIGPGPAEVVAPADLDALRRCDLVFALLDGLDSGTLFEVGYARALGKPVYALAQTVGREDLKMVEGSGCRVFDDFVTAVHHAAWRS